MSFLNAQQTLEWNFYHPLRGEWMELGVSGSVQEALIRSGELPDPFYGLNESKFNWIEDHIWKFKSIVFLDSTDFDHPMQLQLGKVDTYASLYVNGKLIRSFDNAFIPNKVDIRDGLKIGSNEIDLVFTPPVLYHKERWETERYHLPAPNDVHKIAIAPYTRKPQYQFGWDWSLRMNTIGLIGPVQLVKMDAVMIWNKSSRVIEVNEEGALMEFTFELTDSSIAELEWNSELFGTINCVKDSDGRFHRREVIKNPHLWWPRGMGEQFIYTDNWLLQVRGLKELSVTNKFGVKTAELINEPDEWGTSYYFKINGKRFFAKGADYIPQEIFPDRVKEAAIEKMVADMADCNFNMVRVWGGGYYPDEAFFNACDSLGITVWQDFMFACAMYPGDSAFLQNVSTELEYQIPRISSHPSVMLFNGNNEVEVAWGNWGFQIKYGLYGSAADEIQASYDKLFKGLAPQKVNELSSIPYIHTSPLSNWGKDEYYNHGSQHYWGVWHGKDPIEDFGKKIGRFNAEYGFQSFPEFNTLRSFSNETEWDISSDVMKQHQKSYVGNDMILKHAKRLYGEPSDFKTFVYYSQLTQAMAVSMAVAGHRIDAPRCGGTIYWQLNDCWPVSSWSSIDYYDNWKALQYRVREDYRDLTVLEKFTDLEERSYYVVCDSQEDQLVAYDWKLYRLNGKLEKEGSGEVIVNALKHAILPISFPEKHCRKNDRSYHLVVAIKNGDKVYYRSFDRLTTDFTHEFDERKVCIELTNVNKEEKTAEIVVTSNAFVADLWLVCDQFGMRFENNFFSMLPGTRIVKVQFEEVPAQENLRFYYR